jgi:hypothetical protein
MTSTSLRLPTTVISGFGFLLPADPTLHQLPPTLPQTASPIAHIEAAGLGTGWRKASRCHREEIV